MKHKSNSTSTLPKKYSLIWSLEKGQGSTERPPGREGGLFINIPEKNMFLLFSGVSHMRFADVFIFNLTTRTWSKKTCTGEQPKDLCYAYGWYDKPNFFFYGGKNRQLSLSDVYVLDVNTFVWKKVLVVEQPSGRFYHSGAKAKGSVVYIYGGSNLGHENRLLDDMQKYDYSNLNFATSENDKLTGSFWVQVKQQGDITPGPRKGHSMVYFKDYIILFGGEGEDGRYDNKFYKFDIENSMWSILNLTGVNPGYRAYHSMSFFKKDTLIIFGGKIMDSNKNITVTNSLINVNLTEMNCSKPFVADIGPTPRFGQLCAYNNYFNRNEIGYTHCILGGVDKAYCSMDIYFLKEIEINETKKWVYIHKNQHSSQKIDGSDEVFETAKKTIIQFKKKLDEAVRENNNINKLYSENFQTLNKYTQKNQDDAYSSNKKKSQMELKKNEIEKEKRDITSKSRELKDYNNLLNKFCNIQRDKYLSAIEVMTSYLKDIHEIDKLFEHINAKPNKLAIFRSVNLDALTVKRRNYKVLSTEFIKKIKEYNLYEKSIYDQIIDTQNKQKETNKNMYFIIDDKEPLCFRENEEEINYNEIIEN